MPPDWHPASASCDASRAVRPGSGSAHMETMSDSTSPRPVIHDFQVDRLIEETKKAFDEWLERVVKNGPEDLTAASELAASSARYSQLMMLKRSYLRQYT